MSPRRASNPLRHYCAVWGGLEPRDPHPLFDARHIIWNITPEAAGGPATALSEAWAFQSPREGHATLRPSFLSLVEPRLAAGRARLRCSTS